MTRAMGSDLGTKKRPPRYRMLVVIGTTACVAYFLSRVRQAAPAPADPAQIASEPRAQLLRSPPRPAPPPSAARPLAVANEAPSEFPEPAPAPPAATPPAARRRGRRGRRRDRRAARAAARRRRAAARGRARDARADARPIIVVLAHDRPRASRPSCARSAARGAARFQLYVSLDHPPAYDSPARAAERAAAEGSARRGCPRWHHAPAAALARSGDGLAKIGAHVKAALDAAFSTSGHGAGASHAIPLEDDLEVGADFFELFEAGAPLLAADAALFCVSAWNDNAANSARLGGAAAPRSSSLSSSAPTTSQASAG